MFREADTETTREWQVWTYARKQIDFCLDNRLRPKPSLHQLGSKSICLAEFWVPVLGRTLRSLRTSPTDRCSEYTRPDASRTGVSKAMCIC